MSKHIQFEPGVVADRQQRRRSVADRAVAARARRAGRLLRGCHPPRHSGPGESTNRASIAARSTRSTWRRTRLWRSRGESLIVCGSDDEERSWCVLAANALARQLSARRFDVDRPSLQKQGDDAAVRASRRRHGGGRIGALIVYGANPAYDYPAADRFVAAMSACRSVVSLTDRLDETAARAHAVCPDHHFLEAWGDAEPVASFFSLAQPAIAPMFDTPPRRTAC
jgi:molybdopterin-containing oxidoreductase family iron-sulfur binding subunit